jgi:hypothetical protein
VTPEGEDAGGPPGVPGVARQGDDSVAAPAEPPRAVSADEDLNEPPPVGGSWGRLYTGVTLTLALLIIALWLFTRIYAP